MAHPVRNVLFLHSILYNVVPITNIINKTICWNDIITFCILHYLLGLHSKDLLIFSNLFLKFNLFIKIIHTNRHTYYEQNSTNTRGWLNQTFLDNCPLSVCSYKVGKAKALNLPALLGAEEEKFWPIEVVICCVATFPYFFLSAWLQKEFCRNASLTAGTSAAILWLRWQMWKKGHKDLKDASPPQRCQMLNQE